jgi:hypothetical protein
MVTRMPDWPERLAQYLAAHRSTVFAWGRHDCVKFAAGAVQAITGCDLLPEVWADKAGAARVLRRLHGLVPAVSQSLPLLASAAWAQRGDVVLVQQPGPVRRRWLAVADGPQWWAPAAAGLCRGRMDLAVMAWGVGHG